MRTPPNPSVIPHQLLSALSHELRGPLGVARGYLRLLEARVAGDAEARRSVEQAAAAATRMTELLEELSEYARWVRGESTLSPAAVSLAQVLSQAAQAASAVVPNGVAVTADAVEGAMVDADAPRLVRALAPLVAALARAQLGNTAIVLAPEGTTGIQVRLRDVAPGAWTDRPAVIERAGAGLSIALAEIVIERHGWRLMERWAGNQWAGFAIRGLSL